MKHLKRLLILLIAAILLVPIPTCLDDGGTVIYTAILYEVVDQHMLWQENDIPGYLTGIQISLLSFEVYNNVKFVPYDQTTPAPTEQASFIPKSIAEHNFFQANS